MPTERESNDVRKAMAYDLTQIFESSDKEQFTKEDIKAIIKAYISGMTQK